MAPWSRELAALRGVLSGVPRTHIRNLRTTSNSSSRIPCPLQDSVGTCHDTHMIHTHDTHTSMHAHTHFFLNPQTTKSRHSDLNLCSKAQEAEAGLLKVDG